LLLLQLALQHCIIIILDQATSLSLHLSIKEQ
jgi:hypothetical protein